MILETGKEYINRSGQTCVVLDLDHNGYVLVKHYVNNFWHKELHDMYGHVIEKHEHARDIVCEKLNAKAFITCEIYCLDEDKIVRYATLDSFSKHEIEKLLVRALAEGYKFLGVCKTTREIVDNKLTVSTEMVQ